MKTNARVKYYSLVVLGIYFIWIAVLSYGAMMFSAIDGFILLGKIMLLSFVGLIIFLMFIEIGISFKYGKEIEEKLMVELLKERAKKERRRLRRERAISSILGIFRIKKRDMVVTEEWVKNTELVELRKGNGIRNKYQLFDKILEIKGDKKKIEILDKLMYNESNLFKHDKLSISDLFKEDRDTITEFIARKVKDIDKE